MNRLQALSEVDVKGFLRAALCDLGEDDLDELAQAAVIQAFPAGATVCREGEPGEAFFIVVSGRVEMLKRLDDGSEALLRELEPGEFFGEVAPLPEGVRIATVRAGEPVTVLEVGQEAYLQVLGRSPSLAMRLPVQLATRLRDADHRAIVELRQSNEQLRGTLQQLERILEISRELTATVTLEPLLHKVVKLAAELTGSESASILLLDERTGELRFRAASSDPTGQLPHIPVPVEDSIAGLVLVSGEPAVISDTHTDDRHYDFVGQRVGIDVRSLLAVPLQIKRQRIGVLEAVNKEGQERFDQEDMETLDALAAQAAVAIENARLVEALREAYDRLGGLDRLKSDFITIASHELRTPLSLILGYAAVLREQLGEAAGPQLDAVLRAAMRLRQVIETMLNLRYLETGELELCYESFDLRKEAQDACEAYRSLAEANGLKLGVEVPHDPLLLNADRGKVRLVLHNLLSNAVKFTPWGGRVQLTVARRRDQAEIAVADTGIGIPPDALEHIFERFRQVEDPMTRRYGGMGLGLLL